MDLLTMPNETIKQPQAKDVLYAERLELVFIEYEKTLDLDIALTVVPMDTETREALAIDKDLKARIDVCDARAREDLIVRLRDMAATAVSEGVRFTALKELGRTIYPKRFKDESGIKLPPGTKVLIGYDDGD